MSTSHVPSPADAPVVETDSRVDPDVPAVDPEAEVDPAAAQAAGIAALVPPELGEGEQPESMAEAVDAAVIGDVFADAPEATPERELSSVADYVSVYVRYRTTLESHARRYLHDPHDVEDVVQETFLKLFLAMSEITTERHAVAFSRRVITNLCIDRYRAAKRRPAMITFVPESDSDLLTGVEDDPVVAAEDAMVVRAALAALSPLHRAALVKREIEEKPLPQIAAELGIPEASVKHVLHRARKALRRLLAGTSVDPSSTIGEDLIAAQKRLGHALVEGGGIVVVVLLLVLGAIGLHPWHATRSVATGFDDGASQAVTHSGGHASGGSPAGTTPGSGSTGAASHPTRHHSSHVPSATPTSATTQTTAPVTVPTPAPPSGTPVPVTSKPNKGQYKLKGSYTAVGAPSVTNQAVYDDASGAPSVLVSKFVTPTTMGTFALAQTISNVASANPTLTVSAQLPVSGQAVGTITLGTSSQTAALPSGEQAFRGWVSVTPVGTTTTQPTQIFVALVTSSGVDQVLSENVSVNTAPPVVPTPSPSVSANPTASSTPTTSPTGTTVIKKKGARSGDALPDAGPMA